MATYTLPIGESYDDSYRIQIDDQSYTFRFRWNESDESWQCYIGLLGEDYAIKFKVSTTIDLLQGYRTREGVPDCSMVAYDDHFLVGRMSLDAGQRPENRFKVLISY